MDRTLRTALPPVMVTVVQSSRVLMALILLPVLCEPVNHRTVMSLPSQNERKHASLRLIWAIAWGFPPQPHKVPNHLLKTHGSSAWLDPKFNTTGLRLQITNLHLAPAGLAATEAVYRDARFGMMWSKQERASPQRDSVARISLNLYMGLHGGQQLGAQRLL